MVATPTKITELDIDFEIARRSFEDFLPYVKIQETVTNADGEERLGAVKDFEYWPHLKFLTKVASKNKSVLVLKARQVGISWYLAARMDHKASYLAGASVAATSQGKIPAQKLLGKSKFVHKNLPEGLRPTLKASSLEKMEFPGDAVIEAHPSTEEATRSDRNDMVVQDEADFHPYLEVNFGAVRPTVDWGGEHWMVSTADWRQADSFFKKQWAMASDVDEEGNSLHNGTSPFVRVFFGWDARPGRDEAFYEQMAATYDEEVLKKEYPRTVEDALSIPNALMAFNAKSLESMSLMVRPHLPPVKGVPESARVWVPFMPGRTYAAFTDSSQGVGGDYSVTVVGDVHSGTIVADIFSNLLNEDEMALQSMQLLAMYDDPIWGIEDNNRGILLIRAAESARYRRLYHRETPSGAEGETGWHTGVATRNLLYGGVQSAVQRMEVTLFAEDALVQFRHTIRNQKKEGRIEAQEGYHDDYPLAVGGWLQMFSKARRSRPDRDMLTGRNVPTGGNRLPSVPWKW